MVFRQFNTNVFIQVFLLAITCFLFVWSMYQGHLLVARFTFGCLFILQTIFLIRFVQDSNKKLYRFMELLRNKGFMERFNQLESQNSQQKMNQIYNELMDLISDIKIEKEIEHQYFQHILEIIGTCIISFKEDGKIEILNDAARKILNIGDIRTIQELNCQFPLFVSLIKEMKNNEKELCRLKTGTTVLILSINCSHFKIRGTLIRIISFQDIKIELENEELDAYQKLIAVLRHEIMNSITPINSLTETIIKSISDRGEPKLLEQLTNNEIEKIYNSISSIEKRNKGLLKFVDCYRSLTKTISPVFENFELRSLFGSIQILLNNELKSEKIHFSSKIEPADLMLLADEKLLSHVLINLVKNSIEALTYKNNKQIELNAYRNKNNITIIQVIDNGIGISSEQYDKVFIPFYTTKENGSGIGLSISKQILRLLNAQIRVESEINIKTIFTIEF